MAQELLDLINKFGGAEAVSAMAARVGISPEQAQSAMGSLMPMIAGGMVQHAQTDGAGALNDTAAAAAPLATADCAASDAAVEQGHSILGDLFGGHGATQEVAAKAAASTGLSESTIASLLPMVATMAAGALGRQGGAAPQAGGGLGGMLGGILGGQGSQPAGGAAGTLMGMLDANKDGSVVDDIMGFAQRFMKR